MAKIRPRKSLNELLIWKTGPLTTTHGDATVITREMLSGTFRAAQSLGRRLSIDAHHTVSDPSLPIDKRVTLGTFLLELRAEGEELWAVDITFNTPGIAELAETGQYGDYISQEFDCISPEGTLTPDMGRAGWFDLIRITLTDDPATIGAPYIPDYSLERSGHHFLSRGVRLFSKNTSDSYSDSREKGEQKMATTATHVEKIKAIQADLAALAARLNDLQAGEAAEVDEPVDVGDASAAPPAGEEVKKEGDEGGAAAAASQAVDPDAHKEDEEDETDPKKLEEEEEEEVKKMEASEDGAVAKEGCSERKLSRGEADSLASKLLSRFPRAQTASDVIGEIFALESLARASEERERAQRKLSREAAKQANFDLAVARGIVNPLDKSRAEEFRTMPLRSQRVALERGAKLFPTSVKSDRKALERAPAATVPAVAETPSSPGGSFFESLPPELKEMMERSQSIIGAKK